MVNEEVSATRRYLAIFLPLLPAENLRLASAAPPDAPFALVENVRGGVRIAAVDAHAAALGITAGLTLADARARVPALRAFAHQPRADLARLEWVADACDRYSPTVATDPPQGLVIDITGCLHPYGDEAGLGRDVAQRLQRCGLTARWACSETPDAALALAQHGAEHVMALPVTALRIEPGVHQALQRAGLRTIGDLAARPRAPLAVRFGAMLPDLLARLLGETDLHVVPRRHPPAVCAEARFAAPVAQVDFVLQTLEKLVGEAADTLAATASGGRRFEAALFRSDGHVARMAVETGAPTRDARALRRLFRERIEALADPLDPGFGYDLVRLAVPVIEPLAALQLELEGGAIAQTEIDALIDRLQTRLGRSRVRRLCAHDSHIPEQAAFELVAGEAVPMSKWPTPAPGEPPLRPLQLFDPPQRIEVVAQVPDGPPRRFRWRCVQHDVTRYEGPERIAAQWWRRRDNKGLTRDYYRIEDGQGRRFWVFRHGLYGAESAQPDWYIHGVFA